MKYIRYISYIFALLCHDAQIRAAELKVSRYNQALAISLFEHVVGKKLLLRTEDYPDLPSVIVELINEYLVSGPLYSSQSNPEGVASTSQGRQEEGSDILGPLSTSIGYFSESLNTDTESQKWVNCKLYKSSSTMVDSATSTQVQLWGVPLLLQVQGQLLSPPPPLLLIAVDDFCAHLPVKRSVNLKVQAVQYRYSLLALLARQSLKTEALSKEDRLIALTPCKMSENLFNEWSINPQNNFTQSTSSITYQERQQKGDYSYFCTSDNKKYLPYLLFYQQESSFRSRKKAWDSCCSTQ